MELTSRDKSALLVGGGCLVIFCLLQFVLFPVLDKRERLQRAINRDSEGVATMKTLSVELQSLSSQNSALVARLGKRNPNFSLFSFLEKSAGSSGVKAHIDYMKPSEVSGDERLEQSLVEMKLKAIGLGQLVTFLQHIESPENLVGIKRIAIQENSRETGALDVILQVVSVERLTTEEE
ncbi:MAG: hypothetical protein CSA34_02810 [Desulfobulbus propionicus]|nr:MAG: hypothetical protein CSA34_02810 [Desulfobulbus propionicus]